MARCRLPSTVRFRYRRCRLMLTLLFAKLGLLITAGAGAAVSGKKWLLSEITVAPRSEVNASTENARLPPRGVLGGLPAAGAMCCVEGGGPTNADEDSFDDGAGVDEPSKRLDDMSTAPPKAEAAGGVAIPVAATPTVPDPDPLSTMRIAIVCIALEAV